MGIKIINKILIGVLCIIPILLIVFSVYLFISSGKIEFTLSSLQKWYPYRNLAFVMHAAILAIDLLYLKNFASKEINAFRGIWMASLMTSFFSHALGKIFLEVFLLISYVIPH